MGKKVIVERHKVNLPPMEPVCSAGCAPPLSTPPAGAAVLLVVVVVGVATVLLSPESFAVGGGTASLRNLQISGVLWCTTKLHSLLACKRHSVKKSKEIL